MTCPGYLEMPSVEEDPLSWHWVEKDGQIETVVGAQNLGSSPYLASTVRSVPGQVSPHQNVKVACSRLLKITFLIP